MRIEVAGTADRAITATMFGHNVDFWFDETRQMWQALVGVDLDSKPGAYRLRVSEHGEPVAVRTIRILPKPFRERHLTVSESFVNPAPEALEQIASDGRLLAEAYAHATPRQWQEPFRVPVEGKPSSNFGTRSYYNGERRSPHAGVDFTSGTGTPVMAANAGTVVLAAPLYFTGNTVVIDHGGRLFSIYAHLSAFSVKSGDVVARGTVLGAVGATGRVTGPHLHWSVRLDGARVDPLSLIAATKVP
jgi:murein DD-endopeptidase MepM/ murein hydrolase activator NlpD